VPVSSSPLSLYTGDGLAIELADVHAFLNTRDERRFGAHASKANRDAIATPADLKRWLVARDLLAPATRVSGGDVAAATALRDLLRDVIGGVGDTSGLNALARAHPLVVTFEGEPTVAAVERGVRRFLAEALATCARAATDGRWRRLKMCAADDCRFIFYDHGRNARGRWCAMEACGGRMKARSYRARRRAEVTRRAEAIAGRLRQDR
jgi:predicted RNA-binding Zn ribbon-like protein